MGKAQRACKRNPSPALDRPREAGLAFPTLQGARAEWLLRPLPFCAANSKGLGEFAMTTIMKTSSSVGDSDKKTGRTPRPASFKFKPTKLSATGRSVSGGLSVVAKLLKAAT